MSEFRFKDLVRHTRTDWQCECDLMVIINPQPDSGGWISVISPELAGRFKAPLSEEEIDNLVGAEKLSHRQLDGYMPRNISLVAHEDNWWINNNGELGYNAQDQQA